MIVLGSTGSIGTNALEVATRFNHKIEALCAGRNITLLNEQITRFKPKYVCIANAIDKYKLIKGDYQLFFGEEGILNLIEISESSLVINALVGFAGLKPSFKSIECGKKLALANKESLVNAGWLLPCKDITPIDSEHFGLWYLLHDTKKSFKKLYITASGGAFINAPLDSIPHATLESALKHPNWQMGQKITIDSATMVNKLFEVLEAHWLFGTKEIDAFIERRSRVHALVEFDDGSITTHISEPDMKLPIAYAINHSLATRECFLPPLDIASLSLSFEPLDICRYPLWKLKDVLLKTPQKGVVLNASNEVAIKAFCDERIRFGGISKLILAAMSEFESFDFSSLTCLDSVLALDKAVREKSQYLLKHL